MIVGFVFSAIYVAIDCRQQQMRYWLPLALKATVARSLPHPENECQWSLNDFWC